MAEFHFLRPLWFLAFVPLMAMVWFFWHRQFKSGNWRNVCDPALLPFLLEGTMGKQRRWPILLMAFLSALTILALAGPTWQQIEQPVFRQQSALVVVIDLSHSMDAVDIKPSRLARAKLKLLDLLQRRKEGQTALIAFAADAYVVSPLTDDSQTMMAMVKTLSTQLMPAQGSNSHRAIKRATELLQQGGIQKGEIILITDGVTKTQLTQITRIVEQHKHRLSVLGVGTAEGSPVRLAEGGYLKDQGGEIVIPKLDKSILQELANENHGQYQTIRNDERDLDILLSTNSLSGLKEEQEQTTFVADRWHEEGPWLLLLVLPFAALAFRRGYLFVLPVIIVLSTDNYAYAFEWDELWQRPDQKAASQLKEDKQASLPPASVFRDKDWQAAAHYRAGQYQKATEALDGRRDPDSLYNKGNALAKLGNYPEAIKAYDEALKKQPDHEDARYNREQVEKMIQQQQQQSDQSDKNDQKSDSEQKDSDQQQSDKQQSDQNDQQQDSQDQQQSESSKDKNQDSSEDKQSSDQQQAEQQASEKEKQQQQSQAQEQDGKDNKEKPEQQMSASERRQQKEQQQAMEQWLRRIPDDPGGLLRRKFQYEYQRKQQQGQANPDQNRNQAW